MNKKSAGKIFGGMLIGLSALAVILSAGYILTRLYDYYASAKAYKKIEEVYVEHPLEPELFPSSDTESPGHSEKETEPVPAAAEPKGEPLPERLRIDWEGLRAVNPDVVGWIYCEGTEINYPVLHGESNDQYLRHDYTREYNLNGSIFVDAVNRDDFVDANTIIYGHHMNYGAMFANLDFWADQAYYDEHPVMWLLTPVQDYQVVLVSGHHTSAHSDMYEIYAEHDAKFRRFLSEAIDQSDFVPAEDVTVNEGNNYVMLTTCAYIFDDARYVLHGKLVPVESAGGVPLQ